MQTRDDDVDKEMYTLANQILKSLARSYYEAEDLSTLLNGMQTKSKGFVIFNEKILSENLASYLKDHFAYDLYRNESYLSILLVDVCKIIIDQLGLSAAYNQKNTDDHNQICT